jgi:hypothetical protein
LSGNPSLQDLIEVQNYFDLPSPALVEKDWYIVKAIAAIMAIDANPFRLIFAGGTALARAHKLVRRMSEDVDFKIAVATDTALNQSARRKRLSEFRERVTRALLGAGFEFDPTDTSQARAQDSNQYAIYHLPYEALAAPIDELRPTIQIELTYAALRQPSVSRPLASFVAEAQGGNADTLSIDCVTITETAAEKLVSLTRRTGMELAGASRDPDPMLVRHIYDLHILRPLVNPAEVAGLARLIAATDAQDRKFQYPAYRDDIYGETRKALAAIASDPVYRQRYANFVRDMVYGDKPSFDLAFGTVRELAVLFCAED